MALAEALRDTAVEEEEAAVPTHPSREAPAAAEGQTRGSGKSTGVREPELWRVPISAAAGAEVFAKPSQKSPSVGTKPPGAYVNVSFLKGSWLRLHKAEGFGPQPVWMQAEELEKQEVQVWHVVWEQEVPVREEPSRIAVEIAAKAPGSKVRVAYREGDWLRLHWQRPAWMMARGLLGAMLEEVRTEAVARPPATEHSSPPEAPASAVRLAAAPAPVPASAEEGCRDAKTEVVQQVHGESAGAPLGFALAAELEEVCSPLKPGAARAPDAPTAPLSVLHGALPELLARDVQGHLASLPLDAWSLIETKHQPVIAGARPVPMRFHRLDQDLEPLTEQVRMPLANALCLRPRERLFVNFSKYEQGDFLGTHSDVPTGNPSYRRRLAFIWYLADGWEPGFGGTLVDEDADGGSVSLTPSFNTLVSFSVPRRHSVSKVVADDRARLAAYGWVVEPRIETLGSADEARALLQGLGGRALALAFAKEPAVIQAFRGLPLEPLGHHHLLGELVVFAVTSDAGAAAVLGVPVDAVGVTAGGSCRVCADPELLGQPAELRRFIDAARKVFSPCAELDSGDSLLMAELCCAPELKVFVFGVTGTLCAQLDAWAVALQPALRVLLAEPTKNRRLLKDFRLTDQDLPTAVAEDTVGKLGTFWLKDRGGNGLENLRPWLQMLAESVGVPEPQLL